MKICRSQIVAVLAMMILSVIRINAQTDNVSLITGTLYDSATKEPVQTTVFFINDEGKEIKASSDIAGQYQVILTSGKSYTITAKNYLVLSSESTFDIPTGKEYKELRKNLELQKIVPGIELFAVSAFGSGKEVLNDDGLAQLLKLKTFLSENLNVKVKIIINAEDTYLKVKKVRTKVKKKNVTTKITVAEQLDSLLEKRKSNLSDILTSLKIREARYFIEEVATSATKPIATKKGRGSKKKNAPIVTEKQTTMTMRIEIASLKNM